MIKSCLKLLLGIPIMDDFIIHTVDGLKKCAAGGWN